MGLKLIFVAALLVQAIAASTAFAAGSCGPKPPAPPQPPGTSYCVAMCDCNSSGKNCTWRWHCS